MGYFLFILVYLNRSRVNFMAFVPLFGFVFLEIVESLPKNIFKKLVFFVYGINILLLWGLFYVNVPFNSSDYRHFIETNIPPNTNVLADQLDFFILKDRNRWFLQDSAVTDSLSFDTFIQKHDIDYIIATEGILQREKLKTKYTIWAKTYLKYNQVNNQKN